MDIAPPLRRPATLDHLRKKEPIEKTVDVVLSDRPLEAVRDLRSRIAEETSPKEKTRLEKELKDAEADLAENTVQIRFRAIGRRAYDDLLLEYPPDDDQKKQYGDDLLYNPDTFPPALVAASAIEPQMTLEDAKEIFEDWNGAELSDLFTAALSVNTTRRTAELANFSGRLRG